MANSTAKRRASSGKNHRIRVPAGRIDTGPWLSIEDLHQPADADDWRRNGLTEMAATVDDYNYRHGRPSLEPEYPPDVEELRARPSWLEQDGAGYGFVAIPPAKKLSNGKCASCGRLQCRELVSCGGASPEEFVDAHNADTERMPKAVRASGWVNPDAKKQPSYINAGNHRLSCFLKASLAGPADGYRNSTWSELVAEMGWSGDVLAEARQLAQDMGLLKEERMANGKLKDDPLSEFLSEREKAKARLASSPIIQKEKDKKLHLTVAEAFFEIMTKVGDDLKMVVDTKNVEVMWSYDHETLLWSIVADEGKFLDRQLQQAVIYLGARHKTSVKLISEARKLVTTDPRMYPVKITFDAHGMVPVKRQLIDPMTKEVRSICKTDYATWAMDIEYDPDAKCPHWLQLMNDSFADRDNKEREKTINLLQDFTGASLVDKKEKALKRAMICYGPSNTGKTSLTTVMSGLPGIEPISTALSELSGAFGLEEFARRAPWVLQEAFDQGTWHLSSRAKLVISGDLVSINGKNKKAFTAGPNTVGFWNTNHPPKFKEATRAMIERLETKRVFDTKVRFGVAIEAHKHGFKKPEDFILATERPGILNWALDGAKRALDNGCFNDTVAGEEALEDIHRDANAMKGFIEDCSEPNCDKMVSAPDLQLAYTGWWQETRGDDRKVPSPDLLGRSLRALAYPHIAMDNAKFKDDKGVRFYCGIVLNDVGATHWEAQHDESQMGPYGKSVGRVSDSVVKARGRDIPNKDAWNNHPLIKQIRALAKAEREKTKKETKT